ncbi:RpiB/LacA/LacB family sugar-phosphate isomerase [Bacteroidales bacterium OttesenSCG-928-A17]|nr:RpiB/LacA/LacB family sugar-phosphate isomerase [Bacteroidales bacterium OttesenSCG-928-A17]
MGTTSSGTKPRIVGLASDHGGYEMKEFVRVYLDKHEIPYIDYGTYTSESVNYTAFGHKLAEAIENNEVQIGIAACGSGNGINMTLNKHAIIRSALCWDEEITQLARLHNDANVLVLPGRFLPLDTAQKMIDIFLNTPFEGGRHIDRIKTIPIL